MTRSVGLAGKGADAALGQILVWLADRDYVYVTPTARSHALVRDRRSATSEDLLRDIFGWTRPFLPKQVDPALLDLMRRADVLEDCDGLFRTTIRVSTVDGRRYLHSAPTDSADAVFLGPDSYRYARFLRQSLGRLASSGQALDIGVGAGVGALTLATLSPAGAVTGTDVNGEALRLARINAAHNNIPVELVECSGLPDRPRKFDVIAANPPYIAGARKRVYRDGGGALGEGLALDWVESGLPRLAPGGRFLLYTGSAIVQGQDRLREELGRLVSAADCALDYEELDPDVFGGTLRREAYQKVERIAAVGAVIRAP